jgi:Regulator of ribonuclease activity B
MLWLLILFILIAIAVLVRIYFNLRKVRASSLRADWDAQQISQLRAMGSDPFQPHEVDFFFGLPSEAACQTLRRQLELEGFSVDVKPVPEAVDHPFSLHACRSMRLSVPDMQELSHRFGDLASVNGGRYDGWSAGVVAQRAAGPHSH